MAAPSTPPTTGTSAPRRPPTFLFRDGLNPLFSRVLRSPLHGRLSKNLALLTFTGRTSGKTYTIPVGYAETDGELLIGTASGWSRNLRGGVPVRLRLRGEERTGVADVVDDEVGMTWLYRTMLSLAPNFGRAIGVGLDANGESKPEDVTRARGEGHVVVRIRLDLRERAA